MFFLLLFCVVPDLEKKDFVKINLRKLIKKKKFKCCKHLTMYFIGSLTGGVTTHNNYLYSGKFDELVALHDAHEL